WSHPEHFPTGPVRPTEAPALQTEPPQEAARAEARLSVVVSEAERGEPTPVRVRITDEQGAVLGMPTEIPRMAPAALQARLAVPGTVIGLPTEAIGVMYGANDAAQGYAFQMDG